jgi:hypothetical protein
MTGGNVAVAGVKTISTTELTVGEDATLLVVTAIFAPDGSDAAITGLTGTWGAQALTIAATITDATSFGTSVILTLVDPEPGAQTLTLNWATANSDCYMGACSFTGTDTVTGIATADTITATGTSTLTSIAVNTSSDGATVAVMGGNGGDPTMNYNTLWAYDNDNPGGGANYELGGSGTNTHTFTGAGANYVQIAGVHIIAAGAPAGIVDEDPEWPVFVQAA